MRKIFILKDAILKTLVEYDEKFEIGTPGVNKLLPFDDLSNSPALKKYTKRTLLDILHTMQNEKEIYCTMEFDKSKYYILEPGRKNYAEEKYLREGSKESRDALYDRLKIASMIILLLIAIYSFIENIAETKRNKSEIRELQKQVQELLYKKTQ